MSDWPFSVPWVDEIFLEHFLASNRVVEHVELSKNAEYSIYVSCKMIILSLSVSANEL